jgi:hypothetical protein
MSRDLTIRLVEDHPGFDDLPTYESVSASKGGHTSTIGGKPLQMILDPCRHE